MPQHIDLLRGVVTDVVERTVFYPGVEAVAQLEKLDKKRQLTYRGYRGCWVPLNVDFAREGFYLDSW
ncbi:MAG: hypothetical protein ABFR65_02520 [Pseudomonadota bacterium]